MFKIFWSGAAATLCAIGCVVAPARATQVSLDPEYALSVGASTTNTLQVRDSAVDKDGNLYLVGQLWGMLDLDPSSGVVSVAGSTRAAVVKYSASGAYVWHMLFGGTNSTWNSISFEPNGENWWVVGSIIGTANPTVTEFNVNPRGTEFKITGLPTMSTNAVAAKYDQNGVLVSGGGGPLAFRVGTAGIANGHGIKATATHMYLTGNFWSSSGSSVNFNPRGTSTPVTGARSSGGVDAYVAQYSSVGVLDWVKTIGSSSATGYEFGRHIGADSSGNVYAVGHVSTATSYDLGGGLINFSTQRSYLVKFDSSGAHLWSFRFSGDDTGSYDQVRDMEVSTSGNVYVSGTQSGTFDFRGTSGVAQSVVAQTSAYSGYLASFNSAGEYRWHVLIEWKAHPSGSTQHLSEFAGLSLASDGSVYAAGNYRGTMDFDPSASESLLQPSTSSCSWDRFVSRYSSSGGLMWVRRASNVCVGNLNPAGGRDTPRVAAIGTNAVATFRTVQSTEHFIIKYGPDVTAPSVPSTPDLVSGSDTGSSASDNKTTDTTPTISVTASESGGTVTVSAAKSGQPTETCTTVGNTSGSTCTLGVLSEGVWTVTAVHEDVGGLTSVTSSALSISIDLSSPTATWVEPSSPSTSRTLSYTVTFSESVSGIAAGDFSNTGTATGCTFSPASSVANVSVVVTVTCSSDGTVVAQLSANSVLDAVTNTGPVASATATSVTIATPQVVSTSTTVPNSTPISVTPTQSSIVPVNSIPTGVSSTTLPQQVASQSSTTSTSLPTSTSTTTTSTTTSTTLPTIKIPNVTDDGAAVDINGQRFEADISRDNNQLLVTAGVIRAKISAVKREGGRVPLDSNGRIRVERGDSIQVDVVGFASTSQVEVRMYSDPILLGRTSVNSVGSLLASYEIPESVENGRHTVVLIGTSAKNDNVVFALTVYVGAESDGVSLIALLVAVPMGLAVIFGLIVPAVIRRRRDEDEG